jgi:hypothetical protein
MPRYVTLHSLACLTRQGADSIAAKLFAATEVRARRVQVDMLEGRMLVEFEAASRQRLEAWLQREKFHFDLLLRIEYESCSGPLEPVA